MGPCLSLLPVGKPAPEGPYEIAIRRIAQVARQQGAARRDRRLQRRSGAVLDSRGPNISRASRTRRSIASSPSARSVPSLIKYNVGELSVKTMQNLDGADVDVVDGVLHVFAGFRHGRGSAVRRVVVREGRVRDHAESP